MVCMAFRTVDPEDLNYYKRRLQDFGVKYEVIPEDYRRGRHGITRGPTIYFFDSSGNRLETFGGYSAYQMDPDSRPLAWTQDQIAQVVFYYA